MTPAALLAAFGSVGPFPKIAIQAAQESRHACLPVFLQFIEDATRASTVDHKTCRTLLILFYLLGEWRDTAAYRPLIKLLHTDPNRLDLLLGDTITEVSTRIIAAVCDGDLSPICDLILDAAADEFVRAEMIDALVVLSYQEPTVRPAAETFVRGIGGRPEAVGNAVVLSAWAMAIAALGMDDMAAQVSEFYDQGVFDASEFDFTSFQAKLAETLNTGEPAWFLNRAHNRPITDAALELACWYGFSDGYLTQVAHTAGLTGRDDPCRCGSGKQFKRCCLN